MSSQLRVSPILVAKVLRDAGFDLVAPERDGWMSGRTSGMRGRVAARPLDNGVQLALPVTGLAVSLGLTPVRDERAPEGFVEVTMCAVNDALLGALRVARGLLANPAQDLLSRVEQRLAGIPVTERTAEVRRRIGQDVFREALFALWDGRCAVTGVRLPTELLRASHAKPWSAASDHERLDPFNGLLLAVHLDALFDRGLMLVLDDGRVVFSPALDEQARALFSLRDDLRVSGLLPGHLPYLRHHRESVQWNEQAPPPTVG